MNRTLLIMIVVVVFLLLSFGMSYAMEIFFRGKPKNREERKRVFIGAFIWWIFPLDAVGTKLAKFLHCLRWSFVKRWLAFISNAFEKIWNRYVLNPLPNMFAFVILRGKVPHIG